MRGADARSIVRFGVQMCTPSMDLVSVGISGEFKHYTRMSGQGYPECHLKDWPMTSPGAPTDSNLLVHWPWIQAKPWCTGKQLPPGFNPMDLLITDSNLLVYH